MAKEIAGLSQWDALMLESLKAYGWDEEALISKVRAGDLPKDDSKFQFEYSPLVTMANEQPAHFEQAVREGYRIKFNTIGGVRSWIEVALRQEPVMNLEPGQEHVQAKLTAEEAARLQAVLSYGWQIAADEGQDAAGAEGRSSYRVTPVRQ